MVGKRPPTAALFVPKRMRYFADRQTSSMLYDPSLRGVYELVANLCQLLTAMVIEIKNLYHCTRHLLELLYQCNNPPTNKSI